MELRCSDDAPSWIADATQLEPIEVRRRRRAPPRVDKGRRALALALLGVVCFGFVFGALAMALGRRATFASAAAGEPTAMPLAYAATVIGKAGFALHLAIAITIVPWLLFMLPLLRGT